MSRPSVPIWVEIMCGHCAKPGVGRFVRTGRNFRDELVRNARYDGWVFAHREAFCCKEHADAYALRQREKAGQPPPPPPRVIHTSGKGWRASQ